MNGVTTALAAVLRCAPDGVRPCIYTHANAAAERPGYVALRAPGIGIPFYREMKVYAPRLRALRARVKADGADLVHLTTPGPLGLAALYVASRLGLPLIGSFHTDLGSYIRILSGSPRLEHLMRRYMRWPYGRCERIFVPSVATASLLAADRIDPERIVLWARGVDTAQFSPDRRSAELRRAWGVEPGEVVLLYAGRVSKEKGLDLLPAIEARLRFARLPHRWIVVGDGPYRRALEGRLPAARFTGTVPHADMGRHMASADLFVFPSATDTAGNVVLEAQACGLPVIVADRGGPQENMRVDLTGRICRADRNNDFADAILETASYPARLRAMAGAARRYAEGRGWEEALAPLYRAYRELAARHRAAGAVGQPVSRAGARVGMRTG